MNKKQTGNNVASLAGRVLSNDNSSNIQKQLAASALAQTGNKKQTGSSMETVASKVLTSTKYNDTTKKLAASVLAQSNKLR